MTTSQSPIFPRNPSDGDELLDKYGNRWIYNQELDTWTKVGAVLALPIVSERQNGLITPEIYNKFRILDTYNRSQSDLRTLKLLPGTEAYWYYFRSGDKLINFKLEGEDSLRMEVNNGRLYQLIMRQVCKGPRGDKGETGDQGPSGSPAAPELVFLPTTTTETQLDFAIFTPKILETTIAIRLYKYDKPDNTIPASKVHQLDAISNKFKTKSLSVTLSKLKESITLSKLGVKQAASPTNICNIALSSVLAITQDVEVHSIADLIIDLDPNDHSNITIETKLPIDYERTKASVKYDLTNQIACGSIFLTPGYSWLDEDWCLKSRQRGPTGEQGDPGTCYFTLTESLIDNTNIVANCPIINLRFDEFTNTIFWKCADLLSEVCVDNISLAANSATLADKGAMDSVFAAAQMTLDNCKAINRFIPRFASDQDQLFNPSFAFWDPQPGCVTRRNFDRHTFNWMSDTNKPACNNIVRWFSPDDVRSPQYPHEIITAGTPEVDQCCEDAFFYCPNIQTQICASPTAQAAAFAQDVPGGPSAIRFGDQDWAIHSE